MSTEAATAWPILSMFERRLLGVMVEKAKTTPENYPLTINALATGSNQKSNRDPVLNLTEDDVEEALTEMQHKGLVTRITGGRVERWRHNLYDLWTSNKVELAILAELLLRGAQTEGELRGRASRMEPIDDLEVLRGLLRPMAERRLVVFLGPEGRRGTLITHGFHAPAELEKIRSRAASSEPEEPVRAAPAPPAIVAPPVWEQTVAELRAEIAELRAQVQRLDQELHTFKSSLGG